MTDCSIISEYGISVRTEADPGPAPGFLYQRFI
jgi:hypothetical protein